MDGLTFLRKIMREHPTPVIICSSLAEEGMPVTLQALQAGAIAIVTKPKVGLRDFLSESAQQLIDEVRGAQRAPVQPETASGQRHDTAARHPCQTVGRRHAAGAERACHVPHHRTHCRHRHFDQRPQALEYVLPCLPRDCPGIAVVQHMPEAFYRTFARRLNQLSQIEVKEAESGDRLVPGLVLIAGRRTSAAQPQRYAVRGRGQGDGLLFLRHRPSVDVLFVSVAVRWQQCHRNHHDRHG